MDTIVPPELQDIVDSNFVGRYLMYLIRDRLRLAQEPPKVKHHSSPCVLPMLSPERIQPSSFPKFQALPFELRHNVWRYACDEPRYIRHMQNENASHLHAAKLHTRVNVPAILHACKESREEGFKHYVSPVDPRSYFWGAPPMYINFACDVVCLNTSCFVNEAALEPFMVFCRENRLRILALNVRDLRHHWFIEQLCEAWNEFERIILYDMEEKSFISGHVLLLPARDTRRYYVRMSSEGPHIDPEALGMQEMEMEIYMKIDAVRRYREPDPSQENQKYLYDKVLERIQKFPLMERRFAIPDE